MNRFEFMAIGKMLFGNSWKDELARQLNFSVKSKSVDKICRGERGITENIEAEILDTMRYKADMLLRCISQIENPSSLKIIHNDGINLYIDENGFWHSSTIHEDLIESGSLVLRNTQVEVELMSNVMGLSTEFKKLKINHELQLKAIAECFIKCKKIGDYNQLVDLVQTYFELPEQENSMLEQYRDYPIQN